MILFKDRAIPLDTEEIPQYALYSFYKCLRCGYQPYYLAEEHCPLDRINKKPDDNYLSTRVGLRILNLCFSEWKLNKTIDTDSLKIITKQLFVESVYRKIQRKNGIYKPYNNDVAFTNDEKNDIYSLINNESMFSSLISFYCDHFLDYVNDPKQRYIKSISVSGLFGVYSYSLTFDKSNPVSVIYGINGLGKTSLLKLIESLSNIGNIGETEKHARIEYLINLKFNQFVLSFYNDSRIEIAKNYIKNEICIKYFPKGGKEFFDGINDVNINMLQPSIDDINIHFSNLTKVCPMATFRNINFVKVDRVHYQLNTWCNNKVNYSTLKIIKRKWNGFKRRIDSYIKNEGSCFCLLMNNAQDFALDYFPDDISRIFRIDKSIIKNEKHAIPRLLNTRDNSNTRDNFRALYKDNKEFFNSFLFSVLNFNHCFKTLESVFQSFYKDFDNSSKTIGFNLSGDMIFITENNDILTFSDLSSGEKNLFIILLEVIFNTRGDAVFIVDEPEISLHIAWQAKLTKTLIELASKKDQQIIFASHSPFMSAGHDEILVEPKRLENEKIVSF